MRKPIIILSPQRVPMEMPFHQDYIKSNCFNTEAIEKAGGFPLIPALVSDLDALELMAMADGLFLTGGADVSPALYGQERLPCCGEPEPARDRSDFALLRAALALHRPVLCICRGCQLANVYFGGTLYQDLPTQHPSDLRHSACEYPEYTQERTHPVEILPHTPLHELLKEDGFPVNSLHHQAIRDLAPGLLPMAKAPDGLIESWYLKDPDQWVRAYQWHPEMQSENRHNGPIFADFLAACKK